MSATRRDNARRRRDDAAARKRQTARRLDELRRVPVDTMTMPSGRQAVVMPGDEQVTRNRHGQVVYSEREPDYLVERSAYGRALTTAPPPLNRRVAAKIRARRR